MTKKENLQPGAGEVKEAKPQLIVDQIIDALDSRLVENQSSDTASDIVLGGIFHDRKGKRTIITIAPQGTISNHKRLTDFAWSVFRQLETGLQKNPWKEEVMGGLRGGKMYFPALFFGPTSTDPDHTILKVCPSVTIARLCIVAERNQLELLPKGFDNEAVIVTYANPRKPEAIPELRDLGIKWGVTQKQIKLSRQLIPYPPLAISF